MVTAYLSYRNCAYLVVACGCSVHGGASGCSLGYAVGCHLQIPSLLLRDACICHWLLSCGTTEFFKGGLMRSSVAADLFLCYTRLVIFELLLVSYSSSSQPFFVLDLVKYFVTPGSVTSNDPDNFAVATMRCIWDLNRRDAVPFPEEGSRAS
jgi:hypothetical protein